jgi:hypothetical protein
MTDPIYGAKTLTLVFGVIASSLTLQFVVRPAIIDSFRQRIFSLRRRTLLLVAKGVVGVDDPEYVVTDQFLNGLIHFAERFTFLRLMVGISVFQDHRNVAAASFTFPSSEDKRAGEDLRLIRKSASERFLLHVFHLSPLAWLVVIAATPFVVAQGLRDHSRKLAAFVVKPLARAIPQKKIEREIAMMRESDMEACQVAA